MSRIGSVVSSATPPATPPPPAPSWCSKPPADTATWGASYGLPVLAFRFFNVFGPMQPAGHVENRERDVPHSQADNTRLRALFPGIEPVPFPDGLRTTGLRPD